MAGKHQVLKIKANSLKSRGEVKFLTLKICYSQQVAVFYTME